MKQFRRSEPADPTFLTVLGAFTSGSALPLLSALRKWILMAFSSSLPPRTAAVARKEISFRWTPVLTVLETTLLITWKSHEGF